MLYNTASNILVPTSTYIGTGIWQSDKQCKAR